MDLKKHDNIKIPDNIDDFIDKGINRGVNMKKNSGNKNSGFKKIVAASILCCGVSIFAISNVPTMAEGLVSVPVIGSIVKVLNVSGSINKSEAVGGQVTDGGKVVGNKVAQRYVKIYFKDNTTEEDLAKVPAYKIKYSKYPYRATLEFEGIRNFDINEIIKSFEKLDYVKDVYRVVSLSDSSFEVNIEFDRNVELNIKELENPAALEIEAKEVKDNTEKAYFIMSKSQDGESSAQIKDILNKDFNVSIVKANKEDMYIAQIGPFSSKEEAEKELQRVKDSLKNSGDEDNEFTILEKLPNQ